MAGEPHACWQVRPGCSFRSGKGGYSGRCGLSRLYGGSEDFRGNSAVCKGTMRPSSVRNDRRTDRNCDIVARVARFLLLFTQIVVHRSALLPVLRRLQYGRYDFGGAGWNRTRVRLSSHGFPSGLPTSPASGPAQRCYKTPVPREA